MKQKKCNIVIGSDPDEKDHKELFADIQIDISKNYPETKNVTYAQTVIKVQREEGKDHMIAELFYEDKIFAKLYIDDLINTLIESKKSLLKKSEL
jgi:hypothetical protein